MIRDPKTEILVDLILEWARRSPDQHPMSRVLVVGCGDGTEPAILSVKLKTRAIGIDLAEEFTFDPEAKEVATLQYGDVRNLDFEDNAFDLVYSFHVLEHIRGYRKALGEMYRVLAPGGIYMIGTPNKDRLIGYWSDRHVDWKTKLGLNWYDWKMKFYGVFENALGAHAGFTEDGLRADLREAFGPEPQNITDEFYLAVYPRLRYLLQALIVTRLKKFLFPAIYFLGRKTI